MACGGLRRPFGAGLGATGMSAQPCRSDDRDLSDYLGKRAKVAIEASFDTHAALKSRARGALRGSAAVSVLPTLREPLHRGGEPSHHGSAPLQPAGPASPRL